jgi:hypothetical protein
MTGTHRFTLLACLSPLLALSSTTSSSSASSPAISSAQINNVLNLIPPPSMLTFDAVTRESAEYGILSQFNGVDMVGVNAYRDNIVAKKYKGLQGLIKQRGIEVVEGRGKLTSPTTVTFDDVFCTTRTMASGWLALPLSRLTIKSSSAIGVMPAA